MRLDEYGKKYPDLVWDIWQFFADNDIKSSMINDWELRGFNPDFAPKCVMDFVVKFGSFYNELDTRGGGLQPRTVAKICKKLQSIGILREITVSGLNNFDNILDFYQSGLAGPKSEIAKNRDFLSRQWNNLVYGFSYIYESNKVNVRPIWVRKNGTLANGTCFNSVHGIVTALHCIKDCEEIQIEGLSSKVLKSALIFGMEDIDLVLIKPQSDYNWMNKFTISDGEILDEVMVMGYPNHCGFDRFLTATTGAIAAIEQSYLVKYNLMLLTGKIKGGNSGGPVLNNNGTVVGIITEIYESDGEYDKFGYGMAIPSYYIKQLIKIKNDFNFVDSILQY
jgi:S1-C subfamily serine protease